LSDLAKYSMTRSVARSLCDSRASCFFVCHAFKLRIVITETLLCSVIFETTAAPLHIRRFVVVHLYSSFQYHRIFPKGKFILKIANFGNFRGCKPMFLKPQRWN